MLWWHRLGSVQERWPGGAAGSGVLRSVRRGTAPPACGDAAASLPFHFTEILPSINNSSAIIIFSPRGDLLVGGKSRCIRLCV